jgi:hypothetical protein
MQMSIDQDNVTQKAISTMEYDKFQRLIDDFINRSSQEFGDMPASSFFELLFDKMVKRGTGTVDLEDEIAD